MSKYTRFWVCFYVAGLAALWAVAGTWGWISAHYSNAYGVDLPWWAPPLVASEVLVIFGGGMIALSYWWDE